MQFYIIYIRSLYNSLYRNIAKYKARNEVDVTKPNKFLITNIYRGNIISAIEIIILILSKKIIFYFYNHNVYISYCKK